MYDDVKGDHGLIEERKTRQTQDVGNKTDDDDRRGRRLIDGDGG